MTPAKLQTASVEEQVGSTLSALGKMSTKRDRENLVRFGITPARAYGVSVSNIQKLGKKLGRNHALAEALWKTGWYEARMLTAFVDEPDRVTAAQMDRWCRDFDNWGICDTLCFHLFDRTPHAWTMVRKWSGKREEFVKRAAFALVASLAPHDKTSGDEPFLESLRLIERAASDERNFVKKGVSWALRAVGRRSKALHGASVKAARRLSTSTDASARWIGKDALRDLTRPAVIRRVAVR
jgi:3-methyladenine DNA glycosylase AlkD